MIKFIHSADWHLDSPFSSADSGEAARRRAELRQLPRRLADYVNEHNIPLVLLTGDLFDGKHVYRETIEALAEALGSMRAKVLITPGNHDPWGKLWDEQVWSDNVYIFHKNRLTTLDAGDLVFYGGAFVTAEQSESMLAGFRAPEDGKLHIGLFHGEVAAESAYHPISAEDITRSGLDYLALGHIHKRGQERLGKTLAAWPGCPEGRGFDETGEKGFYEGVITESGEISVAFVPFSSGKYEILTVDVTGRDPKEAVEEALRGDTTLDRYRIILTGTAEGVDLKALTEHFRPRFAQLEMRGQTRVPRDLWEKKDEDSLRGVFVRRLQKRMEQAKTEEEQEMVRMAARFGLGALEHRDLG